MQIINVYDAKTHLSRVLDEVAQGEEIIIASAWIPLA
jgi:antitoxin (DNA-binding transcriptional repressor) of toxin-antitoxin stability system